MKLLSSQTLEKLRKLLQETAPSREEMSFRLRTVERDIILPVKAVFIGIVLFNFYFSRWFEDVALPPLVAQQIIERFFLIYMVFNVGVAAMLIFSSRFSTLLVQRTIFTSSFVDGLFLAALTFVTGGFDSIVYWLFLGLIVRNAVSSPRAVPQIILNLSVSFWYLCAGVLDVAINDEMLDYDDVSSDFSNPTEPFLLRLFLLWLMTACCYGVQVLFEKQRKAEEETRESVARQEQLRSAGRLAAQIAHQIKNPLAIINNAAFSLQRSMTDRKAASETQLVIIREEVERSDKILTKLMGYAQLAEGTVEKLRTEEELDRAIDAVWPPGLPCQVQIHRKYGQLLPTLLMQRGHLSEILVNLLQNAREITEDKGRIWIEAYAGEGNSVVIRIRDNGPGIAPDRLPRIFDAYYSTKEKGTGLGLSIVKHNTEIYGGTVTVESELGKGTTFILKLPTRTFMKLQK